MCKNEVAEFGHMHLSIFYRRVVTLSENGLVFKQKFYPWSSIRNIEVWQEPWPGFGYYPDAKLLPRARINFADGRHFLLRGDALVKRGVTPESGYESVFDELVSYLRKKQKEILRGLGGKNT